DQAVIISLYPNPTNSNITIALANNGVQQAEIYSVHGALMWSGTLNGKTTIQTGDWSDGLYIVTSEQIAERFVVRH
ncbi:MAG: T9SS type A sorting domain-containing protein, partial [Flavobacteriales bacterium]|nr:T9SS type A sorting domain-containing protein [Flavobacteriales bacterium]